MIRLCNQLNKSHPGGVWGDSAVSTLKDKHPEKLPQQFTKAIATNSAMVQASNAAEEKKTIFSLLKSFYMKDRFLDW